MAGGVGLLLATAVTMAGPILPAWIYGVLVFGLAIFIGMGFFGSLFLLLRGLARSSDYDPQQVWLSDLGAGRVRGEEE